MRVQSQILSALVLFTGLYALAGYVETQADTSTHRSLVTRAQRIFDFDNLNQNKLPRSHVIALSIALEFKDDRGAEPLLRQLEQRMGN
ncbi:hypothetical protein WDW86_17955 [Bdellovibrionota bacterium FG-2]